MLTLAMASFASTVASIPLNTKVISMRTKSVLLLIHFSKQAVPRCTSTSCMTDTFSAVTILAPLPPPLLRLLHHHCVFCCGQY